MILNFLSIDSFSTSAMIKNTPAMTYTNAMILLNNLRITVKPGFIKGSLTAKQI